MSATEKALREVLAALDGWIEGTQSNHEARGHRDTDCCTTFHPEDIRSMVEGARRVIAAKKRRKAGRARRGPLTIAVSTPGGPAAHHAVTPGDTLAVTLKGYVQTGTEIKVLTMPVNITITGF